MTIDVRSAYLGSNVQTASPGRLLVMLCERLVLDVERAQLAQGEQNWTLAHDNLLHAQDIVTALLTGLRDDVWDGAAAMSSVYQYVLERLIAANIKRDTTATTECLTLSRRICETWTDAAVMVAREQRGIA